MLPSVAPGALEAPMLCSMFSRASWPGALTWPTMPRALAGLVGLVALAGPAAALSIAQVPPADVPCPAGTVRKDRDRGRFVRVPPAPTRPGS